MCVNATIVGGAVWDSVYTILKSFDRIGQTCVTVREPPRVAQVTSQKSSHKHPKTHLCHENAFLLRNIYICRCIIKLGQQWRAHDAEGKRWRSTIMGALHANLNDRIMTMPPDVPLKEYSFNKLFRAIYFKCLSGMWMSLSKL